MANEPSAAAKRTGVLKRRLSVRSRWTLGIIIGVIVAPALWLGIHAFVAYDALVNAEADVQSVQGAVSANQFQALPYIYSDMKSDTMAAAAATSDPVWLAAENLPVVGTDLRAVRQLAGSVNSLVIKGVGPIATTAKGFDFGQFRPHNGTIDMAKIESLLPILNSTYSGIRSAQISANAIDTTHTLGPVTGAVTTVRQALDKALTLVASVRTAARQIPPALGSTGARNYLVVLGSNSQDRANGGAASALALVTIDNGVLSIIRTAPASGLGLDSSAAGGPATLPPFTKTSSAAAADAERSPVFSDSAARTAALWTARFHDRVDVVVSIDSTGLGELASATGDVSVSAGKTVSATSLATYLDVTLPKTASAVELEAANVAALNGVLTDIISGAGRTPPYLTAANTLLGEKRVQLWSADPKLQAFLAATPMAGALSTSNATVTTYGVFFNAVGSGSLSTDLTATAHLTPALCTSASQRQSSVGITLESRQPSGSVSEDVLVYGPVDFAYANYTLTGATVLATHFTTIAHRPVEAFRIRIDSGATALLTVDHTVGGPTPSKVVEIRTSPRWIVTQIGFAACS
ncbi:MAG: hypothetical protein JWQ39_853 [Glaciihabitans sp.]|nr:hypothetical protein [Glaciihabitans sp.]